MSYIDTEKTRLVNTLIDLISMPNVNIGIDIINGTETYDLDIEINGNGYIAFQLYQNNKIKVSTFSNDGYINEWITVISERLSILIQQKRDSIRAKILRRHVDKFIDFIKPVKEICNG